MIKKTLKDYLQKQLKNQVSDKYELFDQTSHGLLKSIHDHVTNRVVYRPSESRLLNALKFYKF